MADKVVKAAMYARVSTDKQDLESQRVEVKRYCDDHDFVLVKEYQDIETGTTDGRNGLTDCLTGARNREYDVLVVVEMSRLTRRGIGPLFAILNKLKMSGVRWVSLREPYLSLEGPAQDLLISVLAWANKFERDLISQRTKSALARIKNLKHIGRPKGIKDTKPRARRWKKKPAWLKGDTPLSSEGGAS